MDANYKKILPLLTDDEIKTVLKGEALLAISQNRFADATAILLEITAPENAEEANPIVVTPGAVLLSTEPKLRNSPASISDRLGEKFNCWTVEAILEAKPGANGKRVIVSCDKGHKQLKINNKSELAKLSKHCPWCIGVKKDYQPPVFFESETIERLNVEVEGGQSNES